jgi:pimeloyl-ACP methyl ester carboxylesterase
MGGYGALSYAARHPGHVRRGGLVLRRARGRDRPTHGASAAPTRRAGGRTCRSDSPRGCDRSRSSSCGPATDARPTRPPRHQARLPGLLARGLSCAPATCASTRGLRALGIGHVWDDYGPGTHDWPYWRRDLRETLPGLARVLAHA